MTHSERMLKWFEYQHLSDNLQEMSARFHRLAHRICAVLPPSAERTVALRKLLEAKDAAVRAEIERIQETKRD